MQPGGAADWFYFFAAAFLTDGFALGAAAFLALGAFGFLVGGFVVFFALGAAEGLDFFGVAFLAAGLLFTAAAFLTFGDALALDGEAAFFFGAAVALFGLTTLVAGFLPAPDAFASSLNEPDAPLPLVWMSAPDSTALLRYFLMNGASFSASTLYWAAMYFLMACRDEPLRSLRSLIALFTISEVFGCVGFAFGFLVAADAFVFLAGVAGAGVSTAVSAIVIVMMTMDDDG